MDALYPSAGKVKNLTHQKHHHDQYMDGISITSGNPCKHVWTYAARASNNGI